MSQAESLERVFTGGQPTAAARSPKQTALKYRSPSFSLAALTLLALYAWPALAQEQADTQSVQIYGGELFGDELTKTPVSDRAPRLDDNITFGERYNYTVMDMWGIQLSAGYTPTRASRVISADSDLGLTTIDLDAVWNITPEFPIVVYALAGAGYAWAELNSPLVGQVYGGPETIHDSNDFTANAGLGAKYYVTGNFFVDLEARYRHLNRLLDTSGSKLEHSGDHVELRLAVLVTQLCLSIKCRRLERRP
jgi:opacity protein-like surface antigen